MYKDYHIKYFLSTDEEKSLLINDRIFDNFHYHLLSLINCCNYASTDVADIVVIVFYSTFYNETISV